jgi:hypothetical protein
LRFEILGGLLLEIGLEFGIFLKTRQPLELERVFQSAIIFTAQKSLSFNPQPERNCGGVASRSP